MGEAKAAGGPVFLVGSMGSGTTLLRLMLDSHENLAIAQETGFARLLLANEHVPFWKFGGEWYGRIGLTDDELRAEMREFYGRLFSRFAREQGAQRWGDKTPFHVWHITELARVFPDSVFVGTVRHPGAVTASNHQRFKWSWWKSARHWTRSNVQMLQAGSAIGDRFALCRYEDLVRDPKTVLGEWLTWLDEPWSDSVLEHHVVHERRGRSQQVEGGTVATDPIDQARITRWVDKMDPEGWRELRRHTDPALAELFGYVRDSAEVTQPLLGPAGDGRTVVTGTALAARMAAMADRIDWTKRPRPAVENTFLTQADLKRLQARPEPTPRQARTALAKAAARRLPGPLRSGLCTGLARLRSPRRTG